MQTSVLLTKIDYSNLALKNSIVCFWVESLALSTAQHVQIFDYQLGSSAAMLGF